ncbi:hypothetical protein K466DRAFT_662999 [Polyporus arcularius HHB13444]|uniref:Fungal-type protein kinase domain-containing protein n=1 Tax=Polyporus arcularius HHB13444 TaxID=1314778 RepID=A0A5C3PN93_9APHY|nr:hypothetical protein K466DRAFT_662999 [Polyporus arcularius HHB13444]
MPPDDGSHIRTSKKAFASIPASAESALQIYAPLLDALNRQRGSLCPGFVFEETATRSPHPRHPSHMKPHICCFSTKNADVHRDADKASRLELGYTELFFEVKPKPVHDFYTDPSSDTSGGARASHCFAREYASDDEAPLAVQKSNRALGQHATYVSEVFARQFRVFVFSVSVAGSYARFLRWDRSGCVVSERFDIRTQPELLCDFLWRFSQTSNAGRGHDVTVQVASPAEEATFHELIQLQVGFQLNLEGADLAQAVQQHYVPGKVLAVHVLTQDASEETPRALRYIVSRPVVSSLSLAGRGTRGFWAVDISSRRVLFLKDTWRYRSTDGLEGEILQRLRAAGVRNIPVVVAHSDVPRGLPPYDDRALSRDDFQTTATDEFATEPWVCRIEDHKVHVSRRKHYRLVLATVGYDLKHLRSSSELLHAAYDVFTAMRDALTKGSRLHRDISVGNILLVKESDQSVRKGYLIDWESSCKVDVSGVACQGGRVGTWPFMSINMLSPDPKTATIQDDLESLLYVILYCALLWLPHKLPKKDLYVVIRNIFDFSVTLNGVKCGGDYKLSNAMVRLYTGPIVWQSGVVKRWLNSFMSYHSPLPGEVDSKSRWTDLDYLDTFWSNFLQTESLETDDRVDNVARQPSTSEKSLSSLDTASEEDQSSAGTESSTSVHPGDTPSVHLSISLGDSPAPVVHPRASTRLGKRPAQTRLDSKSPPATKRQASSGPGKPTADSCSGGGDEEGCPF